MESWIAGIWLQGFAVESLGNHQCCAGREAAAVAAEAGDSGMTDRDFEPMLVVGSTCRTGCATQIVAAVAAAADTVAAQFVEGLVMAQMRDQLD